MLLHRTSLKDFGCAISQQRKVSWETMPPKHPTNMKDRTVKAFFDAVLLWMLSTFVAARWGVGTPCFLIYFLHFQSFEPSIIFVRGSKPVLIQVMVATRGATDAFSNVQRHANSSWVQRTLKWESVVE
ncbi:uncharacterized protein [Henckelia pumila]|uniref:uncharacterized protein n=1 Tax=Henckelia pumila TaxID=405737 RepID=UPI003C6E2267